MSLEPLHGFGEKLPRSMNNDMRQEREADLI